MAETDFFKSTLPSFDTSPDSIFSSSDPFGESFTATELASVGTGIVAGGGSVDDAVFEAGVESLPPILNEKEDGGNDKVACCLE
jgi:hypothetical protein